MFNFEGDLYLTADGSHFGSPQHIRLLKEIHATGSITQAAKAVPMSYKAAWDAVNKMNNLSNEPLVVRVTGGKGGGGTCLTERGLQLVKHYDVIQDAHSAFLKSMSQYSNSFAADVNLLQQLRFQTSARNQLAGQVTHIESMGMHDLISVEIGGGHELKALITSESARLLDIQVSGRYILLIKAPNIEIVPAKSSKLVGEIIAHQSDDNGHEMMVKVGDQLLVSTHVDPMIQSNEGDSVGVHIEPKNIILVKL